MICKEWWEWDISTLVNVKAKKTELARVAYE